MLTLYGLWSVANVRGIQYGAFRGEWYTARSAYSCVESSALYKIR